MDTIGLSLKMRRLNLWLDTNTQPNNVVRIRADGARLGDAHVPSTPNGRRPSQALIATRLAQAEQQGCATLVSETLYMLEHSYRNLQRAGFEAACEKEVYEWNA